MKIVIIDDHPLVAEGIAGLLSGLGDDIDTHVVAGGTTGVDQAVELRPDLILLDLHMPGMNGMQALSVLAERLPMTAVVIVSGSLNKADMEAAINGGAMGYIPKSASPSIMRNALQLVISGGIYVPPEMLNIPADRGAADHTHSQLNNSRINLTPRQLDVLRLLSEGKVNKEIARELDCAETTVKAHIRAVFKELDVRNRTEAVVNAKNLGVID